MTELEHLLTTAMEECNEVSQRISKALRFGMNEIQPGQQLTNRERILYEFRDLQAVIGMCGFDPWDASEEAKAACHAKQEKVRKYLTYSRKLGRVENWKDRIEARIEDLKRT